MIKVVTLHINQSRDNMIIISRKIKSELFNAIIKEQHPFGRDADSEEILEFLMDIWDLRAMPSEDSRFDDAYGDIVQHTINNYDWELEYLFIDRLKLFEDDEIFVKFVENIVNPKHRDDEDEILKFVLLINSYIEKEDFVLAISGYSDDNLPIYQLQVKQNNNLPFDLPPNKIEFHVIKKSLGHTKNFSSHAPPSSKPAFILVYNEGWNDFTYKTEFSLFYYGADDSEKYIGETKITDGTSQHTVTSIPSKFTILENNFCSLGQKYSFYSNLKEVTGRNFESVLYALKDSAFFPEIHDRYEKNEIFNESLIRFDEAEQLLRVAKHKVYGFDLTNLFSFKFSFQPKYASDPIDVLFDFNSNKELPSRIYAIIGKNGTGKTQLITSLPIKISQKKDEHFSPRAPLFSKVIAVSYSLFDNFELPKKTSYFNYIYCGLLNEKSEKKELLSQRQQVLRFHNNWKRIEKLQRIYKWRKILLNFIDEEIINTFIVEKDDDKTINGYAVSIDGFNKIKDKLSSGQSIILYIITEIISNIRLDSLLLFDEPETHLHPNAISQLMNTICDLVQQFQSYCIITTHSPLLIQELFSNNVYIIERHENISSIRKIGLESFGENLTVLTEEVFGNKNIEKQYKKIIDNLIEKEKAYSEIVSALEADKIPLSLNARLYIKSKLNQ